MAAVRRPSVSTGKTSSLNPFDSDDEISHSPSACASDNYCNPFEDEADALKTQTSGKIAQVGGEQGLSQDVGDPKSVPSIKEPIVFDTSNPFDDEANFVPKHMTGTTRYAGIARKSLAPQKNAAVFDPCNPFDDYDLNHTNENRQPTSIDWPFIDDSNSAPDNVATDRHSYQRTSVSASELHPVDENDDRHQNVRGIQEGSKLGKSQQFNLKNRASSLGDSALRIAYKLKESGATRAQRLKEKTAFGASKSKDPNSTLQSTKPINSDSLEDKGRYLLLAENERLHPKSPLTTGAATRARSSGPVLGIVDLESKSVQELENLALQKSYETTGRIQNCVKVAEDIKGNATRTLVTLHQQGEQIRRTHEVAVEIDLDLSAGEKILGSLGGIFSRTWKPKKTRAIAGPEVNQDNGVTRRGNHLEQRAALGLDGTNRKDRAQNYLNLYGQSQQTTVHGKIQVDVVPQLCVIIICSL
eukprot:c21415_g2_i2 orf=415-1827(+)